ncbi:MAG TPA: SPOR domain-containing protein [Luteimonas sp.]|jgi:hypothetical protein|nr:SPOR domain-containing protein [Luteimonas sp.]
MPTRAAIVLLVVLNLGTAAWWWLHAPPPAEPPPAVPAGAARLHLVDDAGTPASAAPAAAPVAAQAASQSPAKPAPPSAATQVRAPATADAAPTASGPSANLACEGGDGAAAGWRVYLPRLPSADAAQATATRIAESGFSDYVVVRDGTDANTIALGRYGTEAAAQRRASSLRAAGFPARCARIPAATPA